MRVLHVINSLSGSGGAEQGMVREILRLSPGLDQMVVRLYEPDALEPELAGAGIESIFLGLGSGNSGWNWPAGAARLGRVIRRSQPDIIHSSLASANLIAQIAAGRASLPVLSTFTLSGDPVLMRQYQPGAARLRARALRRVERLFARRSHVWFRALTVDAKTTNCEVAGLDRDRVTVIPRGVPIPDLSSPPPDRAELGLPEGVPLILNVGRQTAQKGHVDLVRVFAGLRAEHSAHLVILGREGDGTTPLREAIRSTGVGDAVTVIPYTDRPYDYYRAADVFAFPSLMEGLGTAVLEAMACGLPVVAYDIPPVREVVAGGRFGALVTIGDVPAMTGAIVGVLEDPGSARETAAEARDNVVANYSSEQVAGRLEAHLVDLANRAAESSRRR
jgi:glycosyltransferase involved in cell wall biosynthesis